MKILIQQKIQAGFAVSLTFLLLVGATAWWSMQRDAEAFRTVEHSYQFHGKLADTLLDMLNVETGSRGFAVSGDEAFLQSYQAGIAGVGKSFEAAKQLSQDNPVTLRRLAALESLIKKKISHANEVIKLRRSGDTAGALQFIASGQGQQTMDEIRKVVGEMEAEEKQRLQQRTARAQASSRTTMAIVVFASLLALGLVGIASVMVRRDFEKRQQAEAERDRFFTLSLDMLGIANTEAYFKRVNPAFTATLGWSAEEILARPFLELVHPDDRVATLREVEKLAAGQPTLQFENRYQCKDGSWKWLSWHTVPQPDGTLYATARDVTELKLAEENLRRSKEKLAVTLNSIGDAVLATEAAGHVTRMNPVAETLTGWTEAEALGRPVAEVFHIINEETREPVVIPVEKVLATGKIQGLANHTVIIARDGTERPIADSAAPIRDKDGRTLGVVLVFRDVTKERKAERAIRESERRLRTFNEELERQVQQRTAELKESERQTSLVLDNTSEIIAFHDTSHRLIWGNKAYMQAASAITGREMPLNDAKGRKCFELWNLPNLCTGCPVAVTLQSGKPSEAELTPQNQAGWAATQGSWLVRSAPVLNEAGDVIGAIEVAHDITERKQAEVALAESENQLRLVWDNALDSMRLTDAAGNVLRVNAAYCQMMQLPRSALEGKPMCVPYPEARQSEILEKHCSRFKERSIPSHLETEITLRSGKPLKLELSNAFLQSPGQPEVLLSVFRDVTERVKQERLLQRSQRLESIGTLAGGIAHDLNNAIAPIMVSHELLRMQFPGESQTLDIIEASTRRAADMVRQLVTFEKGAEGERNPVPPRRLVRELEKLMNGSFPKNIRLVVKCDPQLPSLMGDATQIHQVLLNLCVNARDAMPHGGTLTLEAQPMEVDAAYASSVPDAKPGKYIALRVRDTGTGIPPEILDRIFDPFFSTKGPDKGTGLGLATVMGMVKGHGGFLQVYSQPGRGSTFTAHFPVTSESRDTEHLTKAPEVFRGQQETILFVDDEPAVREMACLILQRLNFKPLTATDGADGLMQAAQHSTEVRVIITDMNMPHLDGVAFVRALRRMLPDIPILVASGRMEDAVAAEFKTLGVTNRLDKPFTEVQLADALKTLLSSK